MDEQKLREQLKQEILQEINLKRKKKIIIVSIILAISIIALFTFTKIYNKNRYTDETDNSLFNSTTISQEEFSQYVSKEPILITAENWKDYVVAEDITEEQKNELGEIIGTVKETKLRLKDNLYGYMILKLKVDSKVIKDFFINESTFTVRGGIETELVGRFNIKDKSSIANLKDYTIDVNDIECIEGIGCIYHINIPDELWGKDETIYVTQANDTKIYTKSNYIFMLSENEYQKYKEQINN